MPKTIWLVAKIYTAAPGYVAKIFAVDQGYVASIYTDDQGYVASIYTDDQGYVAGIYTDDQGYMARISYTTSAKQSNTIGMYICTCHNSFIYGSHISANMSIRTIELQKRHFVLQPRTNQHSWSLKSSMRSTANSLLSVGL